MQDIHQVPNRLQPKALAVQTLNSHPVLDILQEVLYTPATELLMVQLQEARLTPSHPLAPNPVAPFPANLPALDTTMDLAQQF